MKETIRKILKEELGVPKGIINSAKLLYEKIISNLENFQEIEKNEFSLEIDEDFTFADFKIDQVKLDIQVIEHSHFNHISTIALQVETQGRIVEPKIKIKFKIIPKLNIKIILGAPENNWDYQDVKTFLESDRIEFIRSLSHELKHSYDHFKKPEETPLGFAEYRSYSEFNPDLPPLNQFLMNLYYTHSFESLVRPSELASVIDVQNIKQSDFLNFLTSDKTFKKLKEIQSFSYDNLKKELRDYLPKINEILMDLDEDVNISDDKKIDRMLNIFLVTLQNVKSKSLFGMLVSNPFEALFQQFRGSKDEYFRNSLKKIHRFKNADSFFEYYEKFFNFVSTKMIKKLGKLYAMSKVNESIIDWEKYHKVVNPKYQGFVKESKFFKAKNSGKPKKKS